MCTHYRIIPLSLLHASVFVTVGFMVRLIWSFHIYAFYTFPDTAAVSLTVTINLITQLRSHMKQF